MRRLLCILIILTLISAVVCQDYELENSEDCSACHKNIYTDWSLSMHARSNAENDILYKGMMSWAIEETQGKAKELCENCHTPYSKLMDDSLLKDKKSQHPVDCVYCHSIDQLDNHPEFSNTKYASRNNFKSDYHKIEDREHFQNEQLCMLCHARISNLKNVPICITGKEYEEQNVSQASCQSCHMPLVKGMRSVKSENENEIRSHKFLGAHDESFLKNSLKLDVKKVGKKVSIKIDNSKTPHAYPTGSPLRSVVLKVIGFDKDNKIVFQNWKLNPIKEDQKAVWVRVFEDEEQNYPVTSWRAAKVKFDSRLKAGEVRTITYTIPENVKKVNVRLYFILAPFPILDRLKINDPYLKTAHIINQFDLMID